MTAFIPGVEVARRFYRDVVRPIVGGTQHTAALIGPGSEVLGFDTERSTDHDWAPRLQLFVGDADIEATAGAIDRGLPEHFAGHPVAIEPGPRHRVVVTGLDGWFDRWLGFDPRGEIRLLDWLATPTQRLAEFTGGAVFHDGTGELTAARGRLAWYPDDVWRYVLACQWDRISEEEPFVGRCGEVGDETGAAVVAARLVRDLMRLRLLMRRRYPPYSKWLGTAAGPVPVTVSGPAREAELGRAYTAAAEAHNALGLTEPVDPALRPFFNRPFTVLGAGRFADALRATIADPDVAALAPIGAIDHFVDSTAVLGDVRRCREITRAAHGRAERR